MTHNFTLQDLYVILGAVVFFLIVVGILVLPILSRQAANRAIRLSKEAVLRTHWKHLADAQDAGATDEELREIRAKFNPEQGFRETRMRDAERHFTKEEFAQFGTLVSSGNNYPPVPKTHVFTVGIAIVTYRVHVSLADGEDDAESDAINTIEKNLRDLLAIDPYIDLDKYQKPLGIVILDKAPTTRPEKPIKGFNG